MKCFLNFTLYILGISIINAYQILNPYKITPNFNINIFTEKSSSKEYSSSQDNDPHRTGSVKNVIIDIEDTILVGCSLAHTTASCKTFFNILVLTDMPEVRSRGSVMVRKVAPYLSSIGKVTTAKGHIEWTQEITSDLQNITICNKSYTNSTNGVQILIIVPQKDGWLQFFNLETPNSSLPSDEESNDKFLQPLYKNEAVIKLVTNSNAI